MKNFLDWIAHDVLFFVLWTAFIFTVVISPIGTWLRKFLPWNKA